VLQRTTNVTALPQQLPAQEFEVLRIAGLKPHGNMKMFSYAGETSRQKMHGGRRQENSRENEGCSQEAQFSGT
jgi:hypothetical protein